MASILARRPVKEPGTPAPSDGELPKLEEAPEFREAKAALDALDARLGKTASRREHARARLRGAKVPRSLTERAAALMSGGSVTALDPRAELAACDKEEMILLDAIGKARERLAEVAGELSNAACARVRAQHEEAVRRMLTGMRMAWDGLAEQMRLQSRLRAMGYTVFEHALPSRAPRGLLHLGSPENPNGELAEIERWALALGIIREPLT